MNRCDDRAGHLFAAFFSMDSHILHRKIVKGHEYRLAKFKVKIA